MNILIHGFNEREPKESVGMLKSYLKESVMFNYGWRLFSVLWHNKKDAATLKTLLDKNPNSDVYAHSNGNAIAVESARQGAKIKTLIVINGALKCDTEFPKSIERIIVIYTNHDKATRAARFFDKVPVIGWLIPNAWGAMGAKGYTGNDKRVKNWNLSNRLKGHSDFFDKENLNDYMPELNDLIIYGNKNVVKVRLIDER